jgi:hypothetical protein
MSFMADEKLSKSEKIRRLHDQGMKIAEIAKLLGIRYQFAYNVVTYYVAQKQVEVLKYVGVADADSVLPIHAEGSKDEEL